MVNEPFHDDGSLRMEDGERADEPGSIWAKHLGKDYIARAFLYAHEADPEALLFINDFDLQYSKFQKKIDAIVNLAKEFKERGIPIHGLGMQMHIGISADNEEIASGMRELAATGLLGISERTKRITALNFLSTNYLTGFNKNVFIWLSTLFCNLLPGHNWHITRLKSFRRGHQ